MSVGDFGAKRPREKSINKLNSRFVFHISVCPCTIILNSHKYTKIKYRTQNIITSTYNGQINYLLNLFQLIFCLKSKLLFKNYKILTNCILQNFENYNNCVQNLQFHGKFKFLISIFNFKIQFHHIMKYFKILLKIKQF